MGLLLLVFLLYLSVLRAGWEVRRRVRVLATIVLVGMLSLGGAGVYVVRSGDVLSRIAKRAGVPVAAIADANGLRDPDHIRVGQRLTIPDARSAGVGGAPTTHVVARGESLRSVAARYGIDPAVLAAANGIIDGRLYTGARLRLVPLMAGGRILTGPDIHGGGTHVVRRGESLARIAAATGTTVTALAAANGIRNPNVIREGARLAVPGGWTCPVAGRVTFSNDWGYPREGGHVHEGTDLFAARGTKVVAPVAGTVTQVTGSRGGHQFVLTGSDGFVYIGAHMDTFGASGRVGPGAVLGVVGDTGDARGGPTHLHFEIHPRGIGPVNPYPTVLAACRA